MTDTPFPFSQVHVAATSTPLATSSSGNASSATTTGAFTPEVGRPIYLTISAPTGSPYTGTITILRSRDGGTTKENITLGGDVWGNFSLTGRSGTIFNEIIDTPESSAFTYYIQHQSSSGTAAIVLYQ
jgi:hypothetical protein